MTSAKSWFLIGLLGLSCVVPDVTVVDEPDDDTGSSGKSSKASTGGRSNTAGTNQGGGGGGSDDGGTSSSAGTGTSPNQGGTSSTPTGSAVGKFCNDITVDGENFPLTLTIGTPSDQTTFTADSGTCRPISGKACAGIPVGTELTVTLLADDLEIISYVVDVADEDAWIFLAYADGESIKVAADPVTDAVCRVGYDAPAAPPAQ